MKKLFLMAAMMVATLAASAQVYVGGGLGLGSSKADYDGAEATTTFRITPEIGYHLDDNWAVGIALGYGHSKTGDVKTDIFSIEPYARYTFVKWNDVGLFIEGGLGYSHAKESEEMTTGGKTIEVSEKTNEFYIGVRPGLSIALNNKLTFMTKIGWLGYSSVDYDSKNYKVNDFSLDFDTNNIVFGLYYNF